MALSPIDIARLAAGDNLPVVRALSRDLAAAIAPMSESGLIDPRTGRKVPGVPVGYCGRDRSGGVMLFDEHQLYQAGVVQNTNVKVLGEVGNWKSALVKCLIYRSSAFGLRNLVTDLKGEYTELVKCIEGAKELRFGPDANQFINPLDRILSPEAQKTLLELMAYTILQRPLSTVEEDILWYANEDAHTTIPDGDPILDDLVERLVRPPAYVVRQMDRDESFVREQAYELSRAFKRLTTGHMRGMFNRPTSPGLFDPTPLLVLKCKGLIGPPAVIMIALINLFTESKEISDNPDRRFHRVLHDESWKLAQYPGFVESVRSGFKLGGTRGASYWIVIHHLKNLERSSSSAAIKDLIADSGTTILFRQNEAELRESADELNLSEPEIQRIINYEPGQCMFKIGQLPGIEVETVAWDEEFSFIQTRARLLGQEQATPVNLTKRPLAQT